MAEFKLGRIRFIWKDNWSSSTIYYKDDIVRNGGNTYVCIKGHTAPALFSTDQDTYWNKISDGTEWKSDWQISTYYKVNDIVKYGGYLYIANEDHTSAGNTTDGLELDQSKWDLFAEGFDYKADWVTNTRYKINDIVKFGANVYICTEEHTSNATLSADDDGLEADIDKWDLFSAGFNWLGLWAATTRYRKNDIVKYGGILYICNTGHLSAADQETGLEADQSLWDYAHKGIEYLGDWTSGTRYKINDVVKDGGGLWICTTYHTSTTNIRTDESNWAQFVEGLEFEDSWDANNEYQAGDLVTYGGYSYVAKTNNINSVPTTNPNDWDLFTTGFRLLGDWGDDSSTQDYRTGDVVRVGGYTYLAIADSNGIRPPDTNYWERLNSGFYPKDTWTDGAVYDLGDVVTYSPVAGTYYSYVCVQSHTSDETVEQNRPDQDTLGTWWNYLAGGQETSVVTTDGDLVYYGGAGPTRLPIGLPGQVLTVNDAGDAPEWKSSGSINHIYYVSEASGTDQPAPYAGISLDKPWRTVRYAAEAVLNGPLHYGAGKLIEFNTNFIVEEVVQYVIWNINNPTGIWVGYTTDYTKTRRDATLFLDAYLYDLRHGGNAKTREYTLELFESGAVIASLADEVDQVIASHNYMITVIDAVMSNVAPATNYQTLNSVASPITQIIDATYFEDNDSQTRIEYLVAIPVDALTAGTDTGIPALRKPTNSIWVKTGIYEEVLPIIIPENCAIIGDELRTTQIVAQTSVIDSSDVPYTLDTTARLQSIISDIITNTPITKSTSNAESQDTTRPTSTSLESPNAVAGVIASANEIVNILDNGVGSASALTFTDTGVSGKATARSDLQTNRANIISDLTTWIGTNYPALVYDVAACERDTGYIVDALSFDIQYGTNWASTISARLYYTGAVALLPAGEQAATAAAFEELKTIVAGYITGGTEDAQAEVLLDIIIDVINNGPGSIPTISYPSITWAAADLQEAHSLIIAKKSEIQAHTLSWVEKNNPTLVYDVATCERDAGYIVDAVAYDMVLGTNVMAVFAGRSYFTSQAALVISDQLAAEIGAVKFIRDKASLIATTGPGTYAAQLVQNMYDYIDYKVNAAGDEPNLVGSMDTNRHAGTDWTYAVDVLEANRTFIVAEITAYIADNQPGNTSYDVAYCERDVNLMIDALQYDLRHEGNYRSIYAARYYVNAVLGSLEEDMFYLRNATGLRNCTVKGLTGTLSAANVYGTKRPSAGAFTSLDPGWGPDHEDVWILSRSPYVQNVSTFGTACTGMKVDGSLHNGGYDSIVANDYTQIISDGIGAWVTNLGRAELVSIFTYYAHVGYLAEEGGKIRATNGNNSYGDFGSVAEGDDSAETPVSATVNNQALQATVDYVMTDGSNILTLEYENAGVNYTPGGTTFTITGEGYGSSISAVNTVDGGVFEVRLLDPADDFGGDGYVFSQGVAQTGDDTSITISNTDFKLDAAYPGMSIYIESGVGAGQYAYIDTYNSGTKLATVKKHSDDTDGWDHVVPGTAIELILDDTTNYVIEPRVTFSAPPSGLYADTAKGRVQVQDERIIKVRIWDPGVGYLTAPTITFTDPNNTVDAPTLVRIGDGVLTQPTWSNRGLGFATAQAEVNGDGYADSYQTGRFVYVQGMTDIPQDGSNVEFGGISSTWFKLVQSTEVTGSAGNFSARLQISPEISITDSPEHDESVDITIRYSQVRLTGHDFLDIGTGGFVSSNYPGTPSSSPNQDNETVESGGGRVFYTSTDQDGNFKVGDLFSIEQSTGVATLNAEAFNISGLQELSLGAVSLGGTSAVITEFSTDGTFTANSDNIVPTQKAIKTYIASQIGGGSGELNVNSMTAGVILMSTNEITTTTGVQINTLAKINFEKGIIGHPLAMNYFLQQ